MASAVAEQVVEKRAAEGSALVVMAGAVTEVVGPEVVVMVVVMEVAHMVAAH